MYEGDVKLFNTESGGDIKYVNGQPVMDAGLETAAYISLFTLDGWWGNEFITSENGKLGSEFQTLTNQPLATSTIRDAEELAKDALEWMLNSGLADSIEAESEIPNPSRLDTEITIFRPSLEETFKFAFNWDAQDVYGGAQHDD
jgi:phage gp46-like protein